MPVKTFLLGLSSQMTEQRKQKQRIGLLGHAPHMNINPQQPAWRWMWHAGLSSSSPPSSAAVSLSALRLTVYLGRCSNKKKDVLVSHVPLGASMKCNATWEKSLAVPGERGGVASTQTECCTKCLLRLRSQILWVQVTTDIVLSFTALNVLKQRTTLPVCQRSVIVAEGEFLSCGLFFFSSVRIQDSVLHQQTQVTNAEGVFLGLFVCFWVWRHMT